MFRLGVSVCFFLGVLAGSLKDGGSPKGFPSKDLVLLREVSACRATCLDALTPGGVTAECGGSMDCSQCWDTCFTLNDGVPDETWTLCATDSKPLCFRGCTVACGVFMDVVKKPEGKEIHIESIPSIPSTNFQTLVKFDHERNSKTVLIDWNQFRRKVHNLVEGPKSAILYTIYSRLENLNESQSASWTVKFQTTDTLYSVHTDDHSNTDVEQTHWTIFASNGQGVIAVGTISTNSSTNEQEGTVMELQTPDDKNGSVIFVCSIAAAALFSGLMIAIGIVVVRLGIVKLKRKRYLERGNALRHHVNIGLHMTQSWDVDKEAGNNIWTLPQSSTPSLVTPKNCTLIRHSLHHNYSDTLPRNKFRQIWNIKTSGISSVKPPTPSSPVYAEILSPTPRQSSVEQDKGDRSFSGQVPSTPLPYVTITPTQSRKLNPPLS